MANKKHWTQTPAGRARMRAIALAQAKVRHRQAPEKHMLQLAPLELEDKKLWDDKEAAVKMLVNVTVTTLAELWALHRLMAETEAKQWSNLVIQDQTLTIAFTYTGDSGDDRLLNVSGLGYSS